MANASAVKAAPSYAATFQWFGVELREGHSYGNHIADCPFCGKTDHFHADVSTGKWDCKVCGESGNHFTFFERITELAERETSEYRWNELAAYRGIPAEAYKAVNAGFLEKTGAWMIPIYSDKGTVRDVRCWKIGGKLKSPSGSHVQLAGLYSLSQTTNRETKDVKIWITEGEHDWVAMRWLLAKANRRHDIVVGLPGATTFKDEWVAWFQHCHVIVVSDNDKAGVSMQKKVKERLDGIARRLDFVQWPEETLAEYDISDYVAAVVAKDTNPSTAVIRLEEWCNSSTLLEIEASKVAESNIAPQNGQSSQLQTIAFDELVSVFRKHVKVSTEFEQALAVAAATCLGAVMPSDPIWVYLVGDAGVGKTLILNAFKQSPNVHYESVITRTSLVSGSERGPDTSLLPRLHNKTAIFKDGTELLALHPDARNEVFACLRGAFDGSYTRQFGIGVHRKYISHFNCLIGITPAIRALSQDQMGERFIRLEMRERDHALVNDKMRSAQISVTTSNQDASREEEMVAAGSAFLSRKMPLDGLPKISELDLARIRCMSEITAILRATVQRTRDKELIYRPCPESPTRICKQLTKLAIMLAFVFDIPEVNKRCVDIIRRMCYDSCIDFNLDIVRYMMRLPLHGGVMASEIGKSVRIDSNTLNGRLEDMKQLGVLNLQRIKSAATIVTAETVPVFFLEKRIVDLWKGCF